jgi:hypothetical protein
VVALCLVSSRGRPIKEWNAETMRAPSRLSASSAVDTSATPTEVRCDQLTLRRRDEGPAQGGDEESMVEPVGAGGDDEDIPF